MKTELLTKWQTRNAHTQNKPPKKKQIRPMKKTRVQTSENTYSLWFRLKQLVFKFLSEREKYQRFISYRPLFAFRSHQLVHCTIPTVKLIEKVVVKKMSKNPHWMAY